MLRKATAQKPAQHALHDQAQGAVVSGEAFAVNPQELLDGRWTKRKSVDSRARRGR